MKVIVCGGRDFWRPLYIYGVLDEIHAKTPITALMQGGASGADTIAREWAHKTPGVLSYVCRADWDKHGKAAGPMRNNRMLEWGPDLVVAFPGGRGTADMVARARRNGIAVTELDFLP